MSELIMNEILKHYSNEFQSGHDLAGGDEEALFDALITESDETRISELLTVWISKGHTEDELFAIATIMRSRMKRITPLNGNVVDIVGTGGSRAKTFNVSTAAAFIVAGAGVPVAKHGNRAATSSSGSADVLDLLGIEVDIDPPMTEKHLNEHGLCFMFAPRFHLLSPTLAIARRSIGRPTIFNNLGPLCNPALVPHSVIGVWDKSILEISANVLARLGTARSWIVHGENGIDEIALHGKTYVADVRGSQVKLMTISAADFGCDTGQSELPQNLSASESAAMIRDILENKHAGEGVEKLVLVNAATAIFVAGRTNDLTSAYELATESVRSGSAKAKLNALAEATNR